MLGGVVSEIWEILFKGGAKERLSVLADIFTIVGVSAASVIGGILAFLHKHNYVSVTAVAGMTLLTIVCVGVFALGLAVIIYLFSELQDALTTTVPWVRPLVLIGAWSFGLVLVILAIVFYYTVITSINFT
jgi:hypothetical protein